MIPAWSRSNPQERHDILRRAADEVLARKDVTATLPANYPANEQELMLSPNNFEWAAKNREAILTEWQKRYGSKDQPKS